MKKKSSKNSELAPEIVSEILIKLPLESILECRLVSRSWNSLILQPYLAEQRHSVTPLSLMVVDTSGGGDGTRIETLELNTSRRNGGLVVSPTLDCEMVIDFPLTPLVGSCNGLVCLTGVDLETQEEDILIICNPMLGTHLVLPTPDLPVNEDNFAVEQYAFGYVTSTRQYKVVKIDHTGHKKKRLVFHVCTLGNGRAPSPWRKAYGGRVGIAKPIPRTYYNSTFVNGTVVWIVGLEDRQSKHLICFDLEKEKMGTHRLPPTMFKDLHLMEPNYPLNQAVGIGVYYTDEGNCVLYICDEGPSSVNIWVMEDCKCIESLKLKWVIQLPHEERVPVRVLQLLKDGRLVISVTNSQLAYYDPKTNVIEEMDHPELPWDADIIVDKPSLLGCMMKVEN